MPAPTLTRRGIFRDTKTDLTVYDIPQSLGIKSQNEKETLRVYVRSTAKLGYGGVSVRIPVVKLTTCVLSTRLTINLSAK
jgi:hypothetical protein